VLQLSQIQRYTFRISYLQSETVKKSPLYDKQNIITMKKRKKLEKPPYSGASDKLETKKKL
jgi:hypothetical protein